jgi:hypothetical protein
MAPGEPMLRFLPRFDTNHAMPPPIKAGGFIVVLKVQAKIWFQF